MTGESRRPHAARGVEGARADAARRPRRGAGSGCVEAFRSRGRRAGRASSLIAGEPGVGKSRLLYEFLRDLDGSRSPASSRPPAPRTDAPCRTARSWSCSAPSRPRARTCRPRRCGARVAERARGRSASTATRRAPPRPFPRRWPRRRSSSRRVQGAQLKERTFELLRRRLPARERTAPVVRDRRERALARRQLRRSS